MSGTVVRELITKWGFDVDEGPVKNLNRNIKGLKAQAKVAAVAVAGIGTAFGVFLREAGRFEQSQIAFTTMLGSAEAAQKMLEQLANFAAKTPFTLPGVEASAKQLLAVGVESEKIIPTLKALGDVSAGLSVPMERLVLNFGQVLAQGKLTGRELRDFAVAGVPIRDVLAKNLGVTTKEITEMVSAGKIGFAEVEQAFISMTSEGGRFNNLMINQSKSLFGLLSNTADALIIMARGIGQEVLPEAKQLVKQFMEFIDANKEIIKTNLVKFLKMGANFMQRLWKITMRVWKVSNAFAEALGGWEPLLKTIIALFTTFLGLRLLHTLGLGAQAAVEMGAALAGMALRFKAMGAAAMWAQVKLMLIPLAIGAIIAGLFLLADDAKAFLEGRNSVMGMFFKWLDKLRDQDNVFVKIFDFLNENLNPVILLIDLLENTMKLLDMIQSSAQSGAIRSLTDALGITDSEEEKRRNRERSFKNLGELNKGLGEEIFGLTPSNATSGAGASGGAATMNIQNTNNFLGSGSTAADADIASEKNLQMLRQSFRDLNSNRRE